jgi:hypothetical protein
MMAIVSAIVSAQAKPMNHGKAGQDAMVERNDHRIGLDICLIVIGVMLVGLRLYIKQIES